MSQRKRHLSGLPGKANRGAPKRSGQLDQRIHREIYAAIINHRIPPGTPLQEDALSSTFSVSRTVVRKVLQRLSHEKLVDLVPNKGASVAKPTADEAREVFEARRAFEKILIERAVANASDQALGGLLQVVKAEEAAVSRRGRQERLRLSGEFHRQLALLAGNSVLCGVLNDLISRTSLIIALYESPGAVPCSHNEHREIAEALIRRDARKAGQYMEHHLQHIETQIELSDGRPRVDLKRLFGKKR